MGGLEAGKFSDPQGGLRNVTVLQATFSDNILAQTSCRIKSVFLLQLIDWLIEWYRNGSRNSVTCLSLATKWRPVLNKV
jgi:hypothetical protein